MKSFKKIFTELEKTTKYLFFLTVLVLVLCGNTFAQSTISLGEPSEPSTRLTPEKPVVHGFGVARLSSYTPDSSFKKAYNLALEDFKASYLTSVYLEAIQTYGFASNSEYAIPDSLSTRRIAKIDSTQDDRFAYVIVGKEQDVIVGNEQDSASTPSRFSPADIPTPAGWMKRSFTPVETEHYWISAGKDKFSQYAPYKAWARSKLNALSRLSHMLNTRVESSSKSYNYRNSQLTYVTSKTIFRNIIVLKRVQKQDSCYTLLAVRKENIVQLD